MKRIAIIALLVTIGVFVLNGTLQVLLSGHSFFHMTASILLIRVLMIAYFTYYIHEKTKK